MTLDDGYYDVPRGKITTVITHLEMRQRPDMPSTVCPDGWTLVQAKSPTCDWFRDVFRKVGENWMWFSRLQLDDKDLSAIVNDPGVMIWTLRDPQGDAALLELDFRKEKECELSFFGVADELIGQGAGRFLMTKAIDAAWSANIERFHLQTCTLDSPQALGFYRHMGFTPTHQRVQVSDDPRLTPEFSRELAPHVPIFDV
ncbi:MAG: GNAT family N-acetyltransferase [Paracoccaceae bacterium]